MKNLFSYPSHVLKLLGMYKEDIENKISLELSSNDNSKNFDIKDFIIDFDGFIRDVYYFKVFKDGNLRFKISVFLKQDDKDNLFTHIEHV